MREYRMMPVQRIILIVVTAAAVGGIAYNGWRSASDNLGSPGATFCTQDAFLCPDGSYVVRTGPTCSFAACPGQPSFTGILHRTGSGFSLIVAAPTGSATQEVSYSMPLILNGIDGIEQLVGRKVLVSGTFTTDATLAVGRLEQIPGAAGDPTLGEVSVGQSDFINGVRVTLNNIVQDSRCPVSVQCVQAGWVTANITLQSDTDKETIDMRSDATPAAFDSFHVSIANIEPARTAAEVPDPGSYLITFRVTSS